MYTFKTRKDNSMNEENKFSRNIILILVFVEMPKMNEAQDYTSIGTNATSYSSSNQDSAYITGNTIQVTV